MALHIPAAWEARLRQIAAAAPAGLPLYAVGGCVRDWILKRPTKDLDLVVEGDAAAFVHRLSRRLKTAAKRFEEFGSWRFMLSGGGRIDVVRARRESYPAPAALPVVEPGTLKEDLYRRDFTINAMAVSITAEGSGTLAQGSGTPTQGSGIPAERSGTPAGSFGRLEDPYGGARDLRDGVLRILHPASFRDDPTRLFRAARFLCRFGLRLEPATACCLKESVEGGYPFLLSRERVRNELLRILEEADPCCPFERLRHWGALGALFHRFRWDESLRQTKDPLVRLGLLALVLERDRSGSGGALLQSLHLERPVGLALEAAVATWAARASPRSPLPPLAQAVLSAAGVRAAARRPLLVDGRDLQRLGVEPGPRLGRLLDRAARAQWSGRLKTRADALRWLRREAASGTD